MMSLFFTFCKVVYSEIISLYRGHTYKTFPDGMKTSASKLADLERIGCGGFGEVFKAKHDDWGIVAYKKLPQQFIKETKAVKLMSREVEILQSLRHKNIISICAVVFEEGNYGIVLEFMKYGGLDSFLSDFFPVPLPYKVQLSFDVALGMNYLHTLDKPIIHGDLKIQNVLVSDGYTAKISDFGLSSWKDMSKTSSRSTSGCQGTVTHVPPERWLEVNLPRNQMEDVYAFGILQWEIFTEETPFSKAPPGMISAVVQNGQRPDVLLLPKDLPPVIRNLIDTCWHQDQTKRKPFKEIKETLERYTSEEMKRITASREELQRQESSSSETSIECDGASLAPSISDPPCQTRTSVETNQGLPIPQNETGNPEATDFTNIRIDLKPEAKADEANAAVSPSSLCARSCGNVGEDVSHIDIKQSKYEGGGVGEKGGSGPRVAAETWLCTAQDVNQLSTQMQSDLNIRPIQETNGQSVQVETVSNPLPSDCVDLRSNRTDNLPSETLAKNVTQPKTVDATFHVTNAAGAGHVTEEGDAGIRLSLHSDPPSHRIDDVNLRSSSASLRSSHLTSDTLMSSQKISQPMPLISDRRLNHSQSVPEADAILSPDAQRTTVPPSLFPEENEQLHSADDITLRAEQERNPKWNIRASGSDNNLDTSQGFYPKSGGSFQRHVHPDNNQPFPAQPQNAHVIQPTVPSGPQWRASPTGHSGFAGGYNLPAPMNQPMPTFPWHETNNVRTGRDEGAAWNAPNRDSRPFQEARPKSQENSTIFVKTDDKEVTIIHSSGSGIQIGNNNTMIINDSRKKPGRPPAPSSSSVFSSAGPAASASATKAPVIKKIVVPDKLVDREAILMVAEKIGKDWKLLARHLGLQDSDIDSFIADHHYMGIKEVAYEMLRDWRERKGPEAKMQALARALVDVKRHDIALNLANKSPANSET